MTALPQISQAFAPLSAERERELLKDAEEYVYQVKDNLELTAYCFTPPNHDPTLLKPAIIFFHGGLWDVSMPTQFAPHCLHFASRGMVTLSVEYRVASKHRTSPIDSFEDAQTAILWMKYNYASLGIDPNRIIVAGAASGAHLALSLAMQPDVKTIEDYDPRPQGIIAISAIVNTTRRGMESQRFSDAKTASKYSPSTHVRKGLPPSLFLHGKSDTIVPHDHVMKITKMLKRKKNQCDLVDFEAANHSFFNFNVSATHFEVVLNSMDAFIANLGYIEPIEYI